ncbi:MAG: hypothetical protein IPL46_21730 [Saprospiraceae bacterium]|nr:hypothetical protein [Saprospiraceae bacterium]
MTIRTIPVIFHIIHYSGHPIGTGSNITSEQIRSQIDVLNEDFRRIGNGFNNLPTGADPEIEFCLAMIDEVGQTLDEPGIMRWSNMPNFLMVPVYLVLAELRGQLIRMES